MTVEKNMSMIALSLPFALLRTTRLRLVPILIRYYLRLFTRQKIIIKFKEVHAQKNNFRENSFLVHYIQSETPWCLNQWPYKIQIRIIQLPSGASPPSLACDLPPLNLLMAAICLLFIKSLVCRSLVSSVRNCFVLVPAFDMLFHRPFPSPVPVAEAPPPLSVSSIPSLSMVPKCLTSRSLFFFYVDIV